MNDNLRDPRLTLILEHYGEEHQRWKLVEELGELSAELGRFRNGDRSNVADLIHECADAIVVLTQLCSVIPETDGWTTMDVRTRENVTDSLAQSIGSCLLFLSPMPASMWGKKEFVVVASIYDAIWELATFLGEVPMLYRAVHMKINRQIERIEGENNHG
jgi:hypothetical protein